MSLCSKCNNEVKPNSKFCGECGAQLIISNPQEEQTFKADVKIAHRNVTTEKILRGLGGGILSVSNSANNKFLLLSKRLIKPIIFLLILSGITIGAISGAKYYYTEIYFEPQEKFYGINLLDEKSDIRLTKGAPDKEEKGIWRYKLSHGSYNSFLGGLHVKDGGWLIIHFKDNIAKKIFIIQGEEIYGQAFENKNSFLKIYYFFGYNDKKFYPYRHNYNQILKRFGEPSMSSISDDKLTRTISYNELNIFFTFEQNMVIGYGLCVCGVKS